MRDSSPWSLLSSNGLTHDQEHQDDLDRTGKGGPGVSGTRNTRGHHAVRPIAPPNPQMLHALLQTKHDQRREGRMPKRLQTKHSMQSSPSTSRATKSSIRATSWATRLNSPNGRTHKQTRRALSNKERSQIRAEHSLKVSPKVQIASKLTRARARTEARKQNPTARVAYLALAQRRASSSPRKKKHAKEAPKAQGHVLTDLSHRTEIGMKIRVVTTDNVTHIHSPSFPFLLQPLMPQTETQGRSLDEKYLSKTMSKFGVLRRRNGGSGGSRGSGGSGGDGNDAIMPFCVCVHTVYLTVSVCACACIQVVVCV